jgi:endonuclease III
MGVTSVQAPVVTDAVEAGDEIAAPLNGKSRMVAPNKQRALTKLMTLLSKSFTPPPLKELSVIEHLLFGAVQESISYSRAVEVYASLMSQFHDLNEMRVSHVNEIADALDKDLPDRELKAKRLLQILNFVFETTYSYDLEQMKKKPLKQAQKQLSKIQGTTPFVVNAVVQRCLGGHALPIDASMQGVLRLIEIAEDGETDDQIQATLEHLVPKAKGLSFCLQLSELAGESPKKQKAILKDLIGTGGSKKTPKPPAKAPKELAEPKAKSDAKPSKSTDKEPAVKKTPEKKSVKKKS